jgi:hypothetical protein
MLIKTIIVVVAILLAVLGASHVFKNEKSEE